MAPNIYSQCRYPEGIQGEWKINKSQSQEILPEIEELVTEVNFILRSIVRSKLFLTNPAYKYIEFEDSHSDFWKLSLDREKWILISKKNQTLLWEDDENKTVSIIPVDLENETQGLEILTSTGTKSLIFSCLRHNRMKLDIEVQSKKLPRTLKYFLIYNLIN
ncbi:hypothetical protein OAU52_00160 [bacterium]|nr:hypothetical protein [bacterium]